MLLSEDSILSPRCEDASNAASGGEQASTELGKAGHKPKCRLGKMCKDHSIPGEPSFLHHGCGGYRYFPCLTINYQNIYFTL